MPEEDPRTPDARAPGGTLDWDAPITLQEAAQIAGLSYGHLRKLAADGAVRTHRIGARLNTTTRRWLDEYLRVRGASGGRGRPPAPLPPDYQAPPRRGRPRKSHANTTHSVEDPS